MAIGPLTTTIPGGVELVQGFFRQASSFVDEVKLYTTPFTLLFDAGFDTIEFDFLFFIEGEATCSSALQEDDGVVEDIFFGADEDNVVNVGVNNFATAPREVEKEESRELGSGAGLTLTHTKTIGFVVFLALAEAEKFGDLVRVGELVIVCSEVEGSKVLASVDEVADVSLGREDELLESILAIEQVDVDGLTEKAKALLSEFRDGEELDPTTDFASWNFGDAT